MYMFIELKTRDRRAARFEISHARQIDAMIYITHFRIIDPAEDT